MAELGLQDVQRIEGLGDNCELGFVVRKLGFEYGGLFRWAFADPWALAHALEDDLRSVYDLANLYPSWPGMVRDTAYGLEWHSTLRSEGTKPDFRFVDPEEVRTATHAQEVSKFVYLRDKFLHRAKRGGLLYVIKRNEGIPPEALVAVETQLARLSCGHPFRLLEIVASDDPARQGTVEETQGNRLRGYLSRLAPYPQADDLDFEHWKEVLAAALVLTPKT